MCKTSMNTADIQLFRMQEQEAIKYDDLMASSFRYARQHVVSQQDVVVIRYGNLSISFNHVVIAT